MRLRGFKTVPTPDQIRSTFTRWGEINEVRDCRGNQSQKFIEYFDLRDAARAQREANGMELLGGHVDAEFAKTPTIQVALFFCFCLFACWSVGLIFKKKIVFLPFFCSFYLSD